MHACTCIYMYRPCVRTYVHVTSVIAFIYVVHIMVDLLYCDTNSVSTYSMCRCMWMVWSTEGGMYMDKVVVKRITTELKYKRG